MLANYHTHTKRCNHARGSERDYIEQALAAGMRVLGFSDHTPCPFPDGHNSWFRMSVENCPEYFDTTLERFPLANLGISEPLVLPNYDRMVELALSVHERLHHFDIVGFDIALGQDKKPVMIEYNIAHPSIDSIQFCWGPLFGEDTEEILRTIMAQPVR